MTRPAPTLFAILVLVAVWLIPATAAPQAPSGKDAPAATAPTKAAPAPERAASPDAKAVSGRHGKGIRTLDEITIEGEIAVPQVLFITARDRQRYRDFLHRHYLKTALELARETVVPKAIGLGPRP